MRIADRWFETKPIDEDTWSVDWLTTPNGECDIGTGFDLVEVPGCGVNTDVGGVSGA
jgi:hypothetical protein